MFERPEDPEAMRPAAAHALVVLLVLRDEAERNGTPWHASSSAIRALRGLALQFGLTLDLPLPAEAAVAARAPTAGVPAVVRDAVIGVADDYMTSVTHHPGYVLIPEYKFEQLRRADAYLSKAPRSGADQVPSADPSNRDIMDWDVTSGPPDLPSAVAAEVMGLSWTRVEGDTDGDASADRYGQVQVAVDRVLRRLGTPLATVQVGLDSRAVELGPRGLAELVLDRLREAGVREVDHALGVLTEVLGGVIAPNPSISPGSAAPTREQLVGDIQNEIYGSVYTEAPDPFELRGVADTAAKILRLLPTDPDTVRDAARWRFTQLPGYFVITNDHGPRCTTTYTVGVQNRGDSVSQSVLARNATDLGAAIDSAIVALAAREGRTRD